MNMVDVLLIIVVLLAVWGGWAKGFILGTVDLLIWLGSLLAGLFLYKTTGVYLKMLLPAVGVWILPLSFFLVIILSRIILYLVASLFLRVTPSHAHKHSVNHVLGLIPGFVSGLVYATIISAILLAVPISENLSANAKNSQIAGRLAFGVEWADNKLSPVFGEAVKETMNKMTVEPGSNETVKLNFTVNDARPRPDLEVQMLSLVNRERVKAGLQPVKADPELTQVARAHSQDMFVRGYFSHYTPEGKDPFDRMRQSNVQFLTAGENLALGKTLLICHQGLMNSPGHRANILQPSYGRLGIGILDGGWRGLMISQEFRN